MTATRLTEELLLELYVQREFSLTEIEEKIGRSKSSVHRDLMFYNIPRRSYPQAYKIRDKKRKCWHNDVDLTIQPPLAYILGATYGDGYVKRKGGKERGKCFVSLAVSSRRFAEEFASKVRGLGLHCVVKKYIFKMPRARNWKPSYRATFWCAKFYYWFRGLTYTQLQQLLNGEETIKAFIKGFYEAEGCCYRRGRRIVVSMTNCDKPLLQLVLGLLQKLGFQFRLHGPYQQRENWKPHYRLELGIREEAKRFLEVIKPCIKLG